MVLLYQISPSLKIITDGSRSGGANRIIRCTAAGASVLTSELFNADYHHKTGPLYIEYNKYVKEGTLHQITKTGGGDCTVTSNKQSGGNFDTWIYGKIQINSAVVGTGNINVICDTSGFSSISGMPSLSYIKMYFWAHCVAYAGSPAALYYVDGNGSNAIPSTSSGGNDTYWDYAATTLPTNPPYNKAATWSTQFGLRGDVGYASGAGLAYLEFELSKFELFDVSNNLLYRVLCVDLDSNIYATGTNWLIF